MFSAPGLSVFNMSETHTGIDFSEDYVMPTFFLDKKSCKKIKASVKSLNVNDYAVSSKGIK